MSTRVLFAFAACVVAVTTAADAEEEYPPSGLVGHWDFNEGIGDVVHDKVGWIGDMKNRGNPKWVKNKSGYCLFIDNETYDNTVYTAVPKGLPFNRKMPDGQRMSRQGTITLWAKPDDVLERFPGFAACVFYTRLMITPEWQATCYNRETKRVCRVVGPKAEKRWPHLAVTWDEFRCRLYIDGELIRPPGGEAVINHASGPDSRIPYKLGLAEPNKKRGRYRGYIDEVKYYSRPLSAREIGEQYESEKEDFPK